MWLLFSAMIFALVSAVIWLYRPGTRAVAEMFLLRHPPSSLHRALALTCAANPRGGPECCWLRDECGFGDTEACGAVQHAKESAERRGYFRHPFVAGGRQLSV
jgi:hypothetical protein